MLKTKEDIKAWLDEMQISHYAIKDDLTVDVNDDVDISNKSLEEIPIQFGKTHSFDCYANNLKSLKGAPHTVYGYFTCDHNKLTTLEYAPKIVDGAFSCENNQLTSLQGCTPKVTFFDCSHNLLTSLEGGPIDVEISYSCNNNRLTSLKGSPSIVEDKFNCSYNLLTSLEGCPKEAKEFICDNNQITSLEYSPMIVQENFYLMYNPIKSFEHLMNKEINGIFHTTYEAEDRVVFFEDLYQFAPMDPKPTYFLDITGQQLKSILLTNQLENELSISSADVNTKKPKI